jgi:serine/threonine protein kinase
MEAMQEIELLAELQSDYIVGYLDSFINGTRIAIIMECCHHGNLHAHIKKQNGKPLVENLIWRSFI